MGCEICEKSVPKDFHQCKIAQRKPFKGIYFALCGMYFNSNNSNVRGSNYTAPKKRKKRK